MVWIGALVLAFEAARGWAGELKPELREGSWTHTGIANILGEGGGTRVTLKRAGDGWSITHTHVSHFLQRDGGPREMKTTTQEEGPYPVTLEGDVLTVDKGEGKPAERYTFLCNEEYLLMPAAVRRKPGEWALVRPGLDLVIRCQADPFTVPLGKATVRDFSAEAEQARQKAEAARPPEPGKIKPVYWTPPSLAVTDGGYALEQGTTAEKELVLCILDRKAGVGPLAPKLQLAFWPRGHTTLSLLESEMLPRFENGRMDCVYGSGPRGSY